MIEYGHNGFLVFLSLLVALVAGFTGLSLTKDLSSKSFSQRKIVVALASFALGIGYFAFAELPSAQMILGAGIVIAAGVFVILREAHLGLRRGQARRAKPPPAL